MITRDGHTFPRKYWDLHDAMLGRRPASLMEKRVTLASMYDCIYADDQRKKITISLPETPDQRFVCKKVFEILELVYATLGEEQFDLKLEAWKRDVATDFALRHAD